MEFPSSMVSNLGAMGSLVGGWYAWREAHKRRAAEMAERPDLDLSALQLQDPWRELLREVLLDELPDLLRTVDPFSTDGLVKARQMLLDFPPFADQLEHPESLFSPHESSLTTNSLLGITQRGFLQSTFGSGNRPLRVLFPPIQLGVAAIFYYLKHVAKYNIEPIICFPHAFDIVDQIQQHRAPAFDACVLAEVAALPVLNHLKSFALNYVMPMPSAEQRILSPIAAIGNADLLGEFSLICNRNSTLLEHLQSLDLEGKLVLSSMDKTHREPDAYLDVLQSADRHQRVVAWTPHWQIYKKLELASTVDDSSFMYGNLLFVRDAFRKRYPTRSERFPLLIRDAWARLRRSREVMDQTIQAMLDDDDLVEAYWRYCGLHRASGLVL